MDSERVDTNETRSYLLPRTIVQVTFLSKSSDDTMTKHNIPKIVPLQQDPQINASKMTKVIHHGSDLAVGVSTPMNLY